MLYIALIYNRETGSNDPKMFEAYGQYTKEMIEGGFFKAGDPLQPSETATCVSVRNGKTELKDGPFSETKEQLGGYYVLECANLDLAIECAAKIPGAKTGTVEVRPIVAM